MFRPYSRNGNEIQTSTCRGGHKNQRTKDRAEAETEKTEFWFFNTCIMEILVFTSVNRTDFDRFSFSWVTEQKTNI